MEHNWSGFGSKVRSTACGVGRYKQVGGLACSRYPLESIGNLSAAEEPPQEALQERLPNVTQIHSEVSAHLYTTTVHSALISYNIQARCFALSEIINV